MDIVQKHGFSAGHFLADGGTNITRSESGFDTATLRYTGSTASPLTYMEANFPRGIAITGYPNMFITDAGYEQLGVDVWTFVVQAKGMLGTQPVKRTISTKTQSFTTGPVILPVTGAVSQAQGIYVNLSCSFTYVSLFLPALNVEPQDATVPAGTSLPSPPSNPFSTPPTTPIYNYPDGWIREGITVDQVNGAEVYFVSEEWVYKYPYMPG